MIFLRRFRSVFSALAISVLLISGVGVVPAAAATYCSCGMPTATNSIYRPSYSAPWEAGLISAFSAWNGIGNSKGTVKISRTYNYSTQGNYMSVGTNVGSWYGRYYRTVEGGSHIQINTRTITNATTTSSRPTFARSTATHEIGHLLNLGDNPGGTANSSLMNHNRNRLIIYSPQSKDRTNVINHYF